MFTFNAFHFVSLSDAYKLWITSFRNQSFKSVLTKARCLFGNYRFSIPNYLTDDHLVFTYVLLNLVKYLTECKNHFQIASDT